VFVDRATGEVVLRFHKTDVVRIRPNGDVLLTAGGYFTQTTLLSMNDALGAMGMALDAGGGGGVHTGNWTLRFDDGSACAYKDGMVVRSRGPGDAGRARAVLEAYSGAPVPAGVLPVAAPQPVPRPAAVPQQARQAPQPRVSGGAGAGAPSWAGASMPPGSAQGGPTGASLLTQQPQHHQQQHQPHAVAAQQRYGAAGPADSRGHHGHAPRAGDPAAVARQLAAAAERAGMHDDDLDDDEACVVCLAAARDTVLVPCGHVVLCSDCCEDVKAGSNECPMCRNSIAESIQMG
jgi:1-acyl-sn-glycerol-3-phosphate acyltransferase